MTPRQKARRPLSGQIDKMLALYSKDGQHPEIAGLAFFSSQNLSQPASIKTLHTKPLPGVEPTDITETEYAELKRKRTNVYTNFAGVPALLGGYTPRTGYWADAVWWLLWIKHELEQSIFETMRGSRRMTNAQLLDTIMRVMEMGVQNGGIQPGRKVSEATRADIEQTTGVTFENGILANGYLPWVDRNAQVASRVATFKVWATGSEAIHEVDGDLVFQN